MEISSERSLLCIVIVLLIIAFIYCMVKYSSKRCMRKNWISIFPILFSLIALVNCYPRIEQLGFDYLGLIVGILALLVTVLLGWNIYALIDTHKIRKDFKALSKELSDRIEKNSFNLHSSLALSYNVENDSDDNDSKYFFIYHSICMIICNTRMGLYNECHSIIDNIISIQRFDITDSQRISLLLLTNEIREMNRIDNYMEMINYLSSLQIRNS